MDKKMMVTVVVEGGMVQNVVFGIDVPKGVSVVVRDYDVDTSDIAKLDTDEDGNHCAESTYTKK